MASGKYMTVLQNEKSTNDAILSVLANLHRAARRKNDHIWSPYKYDSLKSIWGDDAETKAYKRESEANNYEGRAKARLTVQGNDLNIRENAVKVQENFHEKDIEELSFQEEREISEENSGDGLQGNDWNILGNSLEMQRYYYEKDIEELSFLEEPKVSEEKNGDGLQGNDWNILGNSAKMQGNYCERDIEELSFHVEHKVSEEKSDEDILRKCQNTDNTLHVYDSETYPQSHNFKIPCDFSSDQKSFESLSELINYTQNQLEINNNVLRRPMQYGAPDKLSFSKQNVLTKETKFAGSTSCKELDDTVTRHVENGPLHHLPQNILTMAEAFYPSKNGTSSDDDDDDDETKSKLSSKSRRIQKLSKQFKPAVAEQNPSRSKRNREDSDSSTGSVRHLQKKISGKTEGVNQNTKDKADNFFKALLSVKIMKDDQFHEITISASEFDRVRRKYPKLREVLPDVDTFDKEVPYCAEAVKVIIGYLFHPPYDFNAMPDGRTSVEILAATKAWVIQRFHDNFQQHFVKKITESNCRTIYSLARHFDLHPICSACRFFISNGDSLSERRFYKSRKCLIAISRYVEPLELCIPLGTAEQLLNDNFDRDIRNTVIFEAITRDFNVAGFQITLDASDGATNGTSAALDIFYSIKLTNSSADPEEIKLSRPLRPNIVVYFKRKVAVKKREKMQISVETTIKPYLCFETYENFINTSSDAEFSLTVESTYRVKSSGGKRFIVGKLLYNPVDEV